MNKHVQCRIKLRITRLICIWKPKKLFFTGFIDRKSHHINKKKALPVKTAKPNFLAFSVLEGIISSIKNSSKPGGNFHENLREFRELLGGK